MMLALEKTCTATKNAPTDADLTRLVRSLPRLTPSPAAEARFLKAMATAAAAKRNPQATHAA